VLSRHWLNDTIRSRHGNLKWWGKAKKNRARQKIIHSWATEKYSGKTKILPPLSSRGQPLIYCIERTTPACGCYLMRSLCTSRWQFIAWIHNDNTMLYMYQNYAPRDRVKDRNNFEVRGEGRSTVMYWQKLMKSSVELTLHGSPYIASVSTTFVVHELVGPREVVSYWSSCPMTPLTDNIT